MAERETLVSVHQMVPKLLEAREVDRHWTYVASPG